MGKGNKYLLGVDLGTGGCKVSIVDADGKYVSGGFTEYVTYHPHPGWSEQCPEHWLEGMRASLQTALAAGNVAAEDILGLTLDASTHNAVLLGEDDAILRPTIMWTDQRSIDEVKFLQDHYGELIFSQTYNTPGATWTLPQLLWIKRHEPEVFAKISRIMFLKDYVRYLLTGTWSTDHIEAQGTLLFNNTTWGWSKEICGVLGLGLDKLPPIHSPLEIVGCITSEAATYTGLSAGTPVLSGASDTALELYSVGAISEGDCVVKMATAGAISLFRDRPCPDIGLFTYSHVADGIWYNCVGTNSGAQSYRWYRDAFCPTEKGGEAHGGKNVYHILDLEASKVPAGSDGLIFSPYLNGERSPYWDPKLKASFVGATSLHGRGHFSRAVLEGVAYSIKDNFDRIAQMADTITQIKFLGGGAKSPLWRQILSDVLDRPIMKYARDDSSFGAALFTGVGVGVFADHAEAISKASSVDSITYPNPESVAKYAKMFPIYKEIHDVLAPLYHKAP